MAFEDIKDLVQLEKKTEARLLKVREEAATIIKQAEEDANRIVEDAEKQDYSVYFKERLLEIEKKKKSIEKETDENAAKLTKIAENNLKKTVDFITDSILGE